LFCSAFIVFFFQAEDGIRDFHVTGVQTCALPIFTWAGASPNELFRLLHYYEYCGGGFELRAVEAVNLSAGDGDAVEARYYLGGRSEERRVGKECRAEWIEEMHV